MLEPRPVAHHARTVRAPHGTGIGLEVLEPRHAISCEERNRIAEYDHRTWCERRTEVLRNLPEQHRHGHRGDAQKPIVIEVRTPPYARLGRFVVDRLVEHWVR